MSMDAELILDLLQELDRELGKRDLAGEIGIVGGAAMCLLFDRRVATKDIDAIFEPKKRLLEIVDAIADRRGLPKDWLNDSVKGFITSKVKEDNIPIHNFPNLKVWMPSLEYLLAMKVISSRVDSSDGEDIKLLVNELKLKSISQIFDIVERYYPRSKISPKSQFFIEDLFDEGI